MLIKPSILLSANLCTAESPLGVRDLSMFNICIDKDRIVATNGSILYIERLTESLGRKVSFKMTSALLATLVESEIDVSLVDTDLFFVNITSGDCTIIPTEKGEYIDYKRVIETGACKGEVGVFSPKLYNIVNWIFSETQGSNYTFKGYANGSRDLHLLESGTSSVFISPWTSRPSFDDSEIAKVEVLR